MKNEVKTPSVKNASQVKSGRIGIYSGTFDPVHAGHLAFALQALKEADLDVVYFLPERRPRYKKQVEHIGHRAAMIERALLPYKKLKLLDEFPELHFSVAKTLPRLQQKFPGVKLSFLLGSDVVDHLATWEGVDVLLQTSELIVGLRKGANSAQVQQNLPEAAVATLMSVAGPSVRSSHIRDGLYGQTKPAGLLKSVYNYVRREWLYLKNPL